MEKENGMKMNLKEPLRTLSKVKAEGLFHINTDFLISYIGDNYEEIALKNIINGKVKSNNLNMELNFLNREVIKVINYYSNDNLKSIMEVKNDQSHGKFLEYYENGNLKIKADFVNDKVHGKVLKYDSVGNIISEEEYKNGKLIRKIK